MRRLTGLFLAGVVSTAACGGQGGLGEAQRPIIGGTDDTGDPSVVLVVISTPGGGSALCTSEVVSPHVLLTDAHCVDPAGPIGPGATFQAFFGDNIRGPEGADATRYINITETDYDMGFNPSNVTVGHDIAVAILASAAPVPPLPMNRTPPTDAWLNQPFRSLLP